MEYSLTYSPGEQSSLYLYSAFDGGTLAPLPKDINMSTKEKGGRGAMDSAVSSHILGKLAMLAMPQVLFLFRAMRM